MAQLRSPKNFPNLENEYNRKTSPSKQTRNGENGIHENPIAKSPQKRHREPDPPIRNGQLRPTTRRIEATLKSLKSPPKSPSLKPKMGTEEALIEIETDLEEIAYEESLRYFEYSREQVKAFWFLPLKRIYEHEGNELRLESFPFPAQNSKKWKLIGDIDKDQSKVTKLYFGVQTILNEEEEKNLEWKREPYVFVRVTLKRNSFDIEKGFNRAFSNKCKDSGISGPVKDLANINLLDNDCFIIECMIRENKAPKNTNSEYVGLVNAGNTCYMNSFLQTLYHLSAFTRTVYRVPFLSEKSDSIPAALQKLFYNLKYSRKPVQTNELIKSFGWDKKQAWIQQDVQEFCILLLAALENKTKGIDEVEGKINDLFEGKVSSIIKCINVDYTSVREEKFLEIQLMVKGMGNIYQSLDFFIQEEELFGDNKYDAESFGKQDAYKQILFGKLPPILLIHLKRFEYNYATDANVKITDSCEYYDSIDMAKYMMPGHYQETKYRLFSVLVHSGTGASSGHYYVFLRPGGPEGRWYKFNDELVTLAEPEEVFEANFGGTHTEAKLNEKKEIHTWESTNESSAYMLVYIRIDQLKMLLRPVSELDVPKRLIEEIENNKKIEEERRKKGEDFFKVYITSFELLQNLKAPGLSFYKMGSKDDEYVTRFLNNKSRRIKIYMKKNYKVYDLLRFISENTGIPQDQIMIWKISIAKEQISQVLKRAYFEKNQSPNVLVLANGVNSNQTKSIFFVQTLDRVKYPRIFNLREKYVSSFFDINCKNELEFVSYNNYNNDKIEIEEKNGKTETDGKENNDKDSSKVEEVLKEANQLFLDLLEEKYILVFLKIYRCKDGLPSIEFRDYYLMNKSLRVHDLLDDIQNREENFDKEDIILYKEDKKKYLLEPLKLTDPLDDESTDAGLVCVLEFKGVDFADPNYITAQEYYQTLSQRVWVTFTPNEEKADICRTLQDGNMKYSEVIELVSNNVFHGEVDPARILLRAKWKNANAYVNVTYPEDDSIKLSDLVRFDDKIFCEVSKIEVNLLHTKLKCLVQYYSVVTNNETQQEEIYMDKTSTVAKLLEDIRNFAFFQEEINNDLVLLNKASELRLTLLDKKKCKLIGQAQPDQQLSLCVQKYRLRVELIPTEYESDPSVGPNDRYYPVYCFHVTKDGESFSNPFIYFTKRGVTANQLRDGLYEFIKDWDIYCDKKVAINKEYFGKLRLHLRSEMNENKFVKVETEDNFPFQELDGEARKYSLEIIHPFALPISRHQMRIDT